jgi:hypothetical protein
VKLYDIAKEIEERAYWNGRAGPVDHNWLTSDLSNRIVRIRFHQHHFMARLDGQGWALDIKKYRVRNVWGNRERMMEDLLLYRLSM